MDDDFSKFEQRKRDHIQLALNPIHQTEAHNQFDDYQLIHEAIPDLDFAEIDLSTHSLGRLRRKPFFVSSMTAGHIHAEKINANLWEACQSMGWVMGVGSQRRELSDQYASQEWLRLRQRFPDASVMANLGIAQLINTSMNQLKELVSNLKAQAFIVHCNPLQELIQPEGNTNFKGSWRALEEFLCAIDVPVVVKETGCGFSTKTLQRLNDLGVHAIDVSGLGGTHWGRIEGSRAVEDKIRYQAAQTFANWGISTASVLDSAQGLLLQTEIWASGGIRHGLDAAKSIALGASQVGIAKPILAAALESTEKVIEVMQIYEYELRVAMFCTGSCNIQELKKQSLMMLNKGHNYEKRAHKLAGVF
jgi:isopentenyl-diphosphate Delta-isomerase